MAKEIYVERGECVGCGNCADVLPDIFRLDDDSLSEVIPGSWESASTEDIEEAMEDCGGQCIEWK